MLGRHGLDINGPKETHVLRTLLRAEGVLGAGVICIMYAGFKRIEP
jgi:hypothetical protein